MASSFIFVVKLLLLSAVVTLVIKYLAPSWGIPVTAANALWAVFLPTLLMAAALGWRTWQSSRD